MKTKEQVLNIIRDLLEDNNTIVTATLGNGGAGLTNIMCSQDKERIETFIEELNEMNFDGAVEASEDIQGSECWIAGISVAYQFSNSEGFRTQVMIDETYDVHFNDSKDSNNKGFSQTYDYCKQYITEHNGGDDPWFMDYAGGTVSIVNDNGETLYSEAVKDNVITLSKNREQVLELLRESLENSYDPNLERLYDEDGHLNEDFEELEACNSFEIFINKRTSNYRVFDPNHNYYTGYIDYIGWSHWTSQF